MGRARPLTIDDFMEVLRILNVGGFHAFAFNQPPTLADKALLVLYYTREESNLTLAELRRNE